MKAYIICSCFFHSLLISQNLILNPSFSDVVNSNDTEKWHKINFEKKSDVLNWYIPSYFNSRNITNDDLMYYFTSRDIEHHKKHKIFTNSEELFNNNLGFIMVYTQYCMNSAVQQHFTTLLKGKYCLKFKYKRTQNQNMRGDDLDFSFSSTNLKKQFNGTCLNLPDSMINFSFNDSINNNFDIPWQQVCTIINLKGNEQFLTIGSLKHISGKTEVQNKFYLDDIELIPLNDSTKNCECEKINRDISYIKTTNYPLNIKIDSDSLSIYIPHNVLRSDGQLYSSATISILQKLISFMQRNPTIKIKFIEHDQFNTKNIYKPISYTSYMRYMNFYGINSDRISSEWGILTDTKNEMYYGFNSTFLKMSFLFYK